MFYASLSPVHTPFPLQQLLVTDISATRLLSYALRSFTVTDDARFLCVCLLCRQGNVC